MQLNSQRSGEENTIKHLFKTSGINKFRTIKDGDRQTLFNMYQMTKAVLIITITIVVVVINAKRT